MRFTDLDLNDTILYTYAFSTSPKATYVATITGSGGRLSVKDIWSTHPNSFDTLVSTMAIDSRAIIIDRVSSLEDAQLRYPEYFI